MKDAAGFVRLGERPHRDLDVDSLRRDLADLWREEAKTAEASGGVARACHSTLVVAARRDDDLDDFLLDLVRLHPARLLLVREDPGRPFGEVEAWVSALCARGPGGGTFLCSETVHLEAAPDAADRVASAIRSLTVGGLPVVVLAETVSPLDLDWVSALGSTPDLILGDSAVLEDAAAEALWARCGNRGTRYRDLQWMRLKDWRRAMALWFDRPGMAGSLPAMAGIRVEIAADPGARQKARLFLGWLGSRLGWDPESLDHRENGLRITAPGGPVDLEVREVAAGEDPSSIRAVEMSFRSSWPSVNWRRLAAERAIRVEDAKGGRLRLNQTKTGRAEAVVAMIHEHVPDPVAPFAMQFARMLGGIR